MSVQEKEVIDEISGKYNGRKVGKRIQRNGGKVDFKVRLKATKRRELVSPRTVETEYRLDPEKDVIEDTETNRIYLVPVSDDLQVHKEQTVHARKMEALEKSFNRDDERIDILERKNRQLKRHLDRLLDEGEDSDEEQSSAPQQRYECKTCGKTMTEKQKEENDDRCTQCNRETLELMD